MILKACDYNKLNTSCPVISSAELDDTFRIRVPYILIGYRLYDVLEVSCSPNRTVSFDGIQFDKFHPWVDIPTCNLNRTSGKHTYKLSFMNECRGQYITTYISYIVQDDSPEKKYLYVNDIYNESDEEKYGYYVI